MPALNSRDLALQALQERVLDLTSSSITLVPSTTLIDYSSAGTASTSSITINAVITGSIYTPVEFLFTGLISGRQPTITDNTAVVNVSDIQGNSLIVNARVIKFGNTYEALPITITKNYLEITPVVLRNSDNIPTNYLGQNYTLPNPTFLKLYSGISEISSGIVYGPNSSQIKNGLITNINSTTGQITISDSGTNAWTTDSETFTFSATYNNKIYNVSYSIFKVRSILIPTPNSVISDTITLTYGKVSKTNSLANIKWSAPTLVSGGLPIDFYEISATYTATTGIAKTIFYKSLTNVLDIVADWSSSITIDIKVVDTQGNKSTSTIKTFTKDSPSKVTGQEAAVVGTGIEIKWPENTISNSQLPIAGYELRLENQNFGFSNSELVWRGTATKVFVDLIDKSNNQVFTGYLRAFDIEGNYSTESTIISYTVSAPTNSIVINNPIFEDTSLTAATFTLSWTQAQPIFGLDSYRIQYTYTTKGASPQQKSVDIKTKSNSVTLPANWLGTITVSISIIDGLGNESIAQTKSIVIQAPNSVLSITPQVIDNNVLLKWVYPQKTTLPISHIRLKYSAPNVTLWANATLIGDKDGTFTSFQEQVPGSYRYWLVVVDTENNESLASYIDVEVNEPPNYVFVAEQTSSFSNTAGLISALVENNSVVLPVNLTETWNSHFSTRSWASPQAQINAGYPIYIQPGTTTGSYTETFDFGSTILAGVQITLDIFGTALAGIPQVNFQVETSTNNSTWTAAVQNSKYILTTQNFRYVRVKVTVTQTNLGDLYRLTRLYIKLDTTKKDNSGIATTNTSGIVDVNFTKDFFDISAINVSVSSTTPLLAVYDFKDTVLTGTYSVTSGVCTATINTHPLLTGYKIRASFTGTGTIPTSQSYIITKTGTNTFTFPVLTANNGTTGNIEAYPNSMRISVFNSAGSAVTSATQVSWYVEGY